MKLWMNVLVMVGIAFPVVLVAADEREPKHNLIEAVYQDLEFAEEPAAKRRKTSEGVEDMQQVPVAVQRVFFSRDIQYFIKHLFEREEGKIFAAYFHASSKELLSTLINRKFLQESAKFDRKMDQKRAMVGCDDGEWGKEYRAGQSTLEQYRVSPKGDILIVDKDCIKQNKKNCRLLKKVVHAGISVLVRNANREPSTRYQSMHYKFMIFFDKENTGLAKFVVVGSFNLTNQASYFNWEDVVIIDDPLTVSQFVDEHANLCCECESLESVLSRRTEQSLTMDEDVQGELPLQSKVYFGGQIEPVLKNFMRAEQGNIAAAYYQVSSDQLLSCWAERNSSGKKDDVLIIDEQTLSGRDRDSAYFRLMMFADKGIKVLVRTQKRSPSNEEQSMHYKFMIFFHKDRPEAGKLVITGSFNLTNQASNSGNWEDIVILDDQDTVDRYVHEQVDLRRYCLPLEKVFKRT